MISWRFFGYWSMFVGVRLQFLAWFRSRVRLSDSGLVFLSALLRPLSRPVRLLGLLAVFSFGRFCVCVLPDFLLSGLSPRWACFLLPWPERLPPDLSLFALVSLWALTASGLLRLAFGIELGGL